MAEPTRAGPGNVPRVSTAMGANDPRNRRLHQGLQIPETLLDLDRFDIKADGRISLKPVKFTGTTVEDLIACLKNAGILE